MDLDEQINSLRRELLDTEDCNPEGVSCPECAHSWPELVAEIRALQGHIFILHEALTDGPCICVVCSEYRRVA